jgi:hypothetical protein
VVALTGLPPGSGAEVYLELKLEKRWGDKMEDGIAARSGCEGVAELMSGIGAERWARGKPVASMVAKSIC